ncbi:MAG TPA: LrgB family protein [Candidatus Onthenecus intestinigallinarum]|uniref:LrgB family protein n=1 Tax=Candidatus Onthenecus intestinigallinarum TaxID=2840875 RepID=A0A9D0ZBA3_9FIRM|nr:LrgB family protein [Candidatus Onthenecus intestinigallinarum]
MNELFESPVFGIALSALAYWAGQALHRRTRLTALNPLLVAIALVCAVLLALDIPYDAYDQGGSVINLFLLPATACLAVPIYQKRALLRAHWLPILVGCICGSVASMCSVFLLCRLFGLDAQMTASLLPKSVTTPIAVSVSGQAGGVVPVTVVAVIFTGILGSIFAPALIRLFRVRDDMEAGLSIGACSHAMGTSKALELGQTQGAMSGLAIGVCGLATVILSLLLRL